MERIERFYTISIRIFILYLHFVISFCIFILYFHFVFSFCIFILYLHFVFSFCIFILYFHFVFSSCIFIFICQPHWFHRSTAISNICHMKRFRELQSNISLFITLFDFYFYSHFFPFNFIFLLLVEKKERWKSVYG